VTDFYLTVPFPGAVSRSAHLPGLEFVHPELRAALDTAVTARRELDERRAAVDRCGLPSPHQRRTELEAAVDEAEAEAARRYEAAQLTAARTADAWAGHLHDRYRRAVERITVAHAELATAFAEAVACARLLPVTKANPISLSMPNGGPVPGVARRLSTAVVALREAMTPADLPGITE
jgi:hypothetical protein